MDKSDYKTTPAHPGTPLEPAELPESPPEFQTATQAARSEESGFEEGTHPTTELDVRTGQKAGRPEGKPKTHPTAELHVKPRRR